MKLSVRKILFLLKQDKGFTLVELLTVISIISILTALLTVSFVNVSQRSRDGARKSNLKQIQAALETYKFDKDGYPANSGTFTITASCGVAFTDGGSPAITYMSKMPCDPKSSTATPIQYFYVSCGTAPCSTYILASCIENAGDKDATTTKPNVNMNCTYTTPGSYFVVTNP